jgi:molybdopterin molybdotransferase
MVLATDVTAQADIPPHRNSAMDGYAARAADLRRGGGPITLRVVGESAAGRPAERIVGEGEAVRIMTGAVMPEGADTVVRFEDTRPLPGGIEVVRSPRAGANVREPGEDVRAGAVVLPAGTVIRPQEVGMLAALGRLLVPVHRRPRVALLATGDEVAEIDAPLRPGMVRNSNSYSNAAQTLRAGGVPLLLGVAQDRAEQLTAALRRAVAAGADLIVTSGGVSVGDFDLVKDVLATEGRMGFWWVNMKPGRPVAFGEVAGVPLLALPGNPVAAMLGFELFARPAVRKMLGHASWERLSVVARLRSAIERKDSRRHYLRVRLLPVGDGWEAELTGDQGSGILTSMVQADGLAILPEDRDRLEAGAAVRVLILD